MFDIGIVVGKFAPLTQGHINLITQASLQAKKVIVVLSHDNRWLAQQCPRDQKALTFTNRLRWLQQHYADSAHIDIKYIIEDDIPEFPNGWSAYCNLLRKIYTEEQHKNYKEIGTTAGTITTRRIAQTVAIFSSEIDYDKGYEEHLPEVSHVVVDAHRTAVPISAAKIRENLYANWEYLPSIVRKDYTKRIVILGQESCGKSVMVKNLAKMFNTSWVEEYGRTYCETELCGSESTLRSDDYPVIAYRHKELEIQAMRSANRICIVDTNAFITEYYHRLYEGKPNRIVSAIAAEENYDLVIVLEPTVAWVDDGLRSNPERQRTTELFNLMCLEFPNQFPEGRTFHISSSDYKVRFDQAYEIIKTFTQRVNTGDF